MKEIYAQQVELLIRCLPQVEKESCFAIKGGTAINLFLLNMPRLSVDIDLTYLPIASREASVTEMEAALGRIERGIKATIAGAFVQVVRGSGGELARLIVRLGTAHIKIEPNYVNRGAVFDPVSMDLCGAAQEQFSMFASATVLSKGDLYGGKICAALDRQHPRDLFDIKILLEAGELTDDVRQAFVVYLAGHNRTMHELLRPTRKDIRAVYESSFVGMVEDAPTVETLDAAREKLIDAVNHGLTDDERAFLLSMKRGEPDWERLPIAHVQALPAVQWKLMNTRRMDKQKHAKALAALEEVLGL